MSRFSLLTILFPFLITAAFAQSSAERADSLFKNYEEKKALEAYNNILEDDPRNLSALWRSSLLYSRVGNRLENEDQEKQYYKMAEERARKALQIDSTDSHANFVMAVAMGRKALIVGARERVAASKDIKKFAERALQADSSNAGAWHVLGRWNYEISTLNFAERLAANVLFGGIPEGASTEKAVSSIKKAIELRPEFLLYYYDLAKAYEELGKEQEAIESCKKGLELPAKAPGDDAIKEDCREFIDDLK